MERRGEVTNRFPRRSERVRPDERDMTTTILSPPPSSSSHFLSPGQIRQIKTTESGDIKERKRERKKGLKLELRASTLIYGLISPRLRLSRGFFFYTNKASVIVESPILLQYRYIKKSKDRLRDPALQVTICSTATL